MVALILILDLEIYIKNILNLKFKDLIKI
jgi:hypothetical protein